MPKVVSRFLRVFSGPMLRRAAPVASLIILVLIFLTLLIYHSERTGERRAYQAEQAGIVRRASEQYIASQLGPLVSDIAILAAIDEIDYIFSIGGELTKQNLADELVSFISHRGLYERVQLLNTHGRNLVSVVYEDGEATVAIEDQSPTPLTSQSFTETARLHADEVALSPFVLDTSQGRIIEPIRPIMQVATPLFDRFGTRSGALVLTYLGAQLLDGLQEGADAQGSISLLNGDGYMLRSSDAGDAWGFMYPDRQSVSFAHASPEVWAKVAAAESGQFYTSAGLYTFATVYPQQIVRRFEAAALAASNEASVRSAYERGYAWKIITFVPAAALTANANEMLGWLLTADGLLLLFSLVGGFYLMRSAAGREQAQEAQQEAQAMYRALIEQVPAITYLSAARDPAQTLFVSQQIQELLGFSAVEWVQNPNLALDQVHPDDRERVQAVIGQCTLQPQGFSLEYRMFSRDGQLRWFRDDAKIVRDGDDKPLFLQGIKFDITELKGVEDALRISNQEVIDELKERRRVEEALQAAEAETRAVLTSAKDSIYIKDLDLIYRLVNPAMGELFEQAPEALIGKTDRDLFPDGLVEKVEAEDQRVLAGEMVLVETSWARAGVTRSFDVIKVPLRNARGEVAGICGIARDVTERKHMEAELQRAKDEAEAASQAKSEFLAGMSHEIRTPLNAVIGMTGLLLDTGLNEEQRDYVETIRGSGDSLLTIINDILDFSKIEAGRLDLERHPFDVAQCVEEALDLLAPRASEKGLDLIYSMPAALPTTFVGDITRLRQILVNLIGNAVKFTERGEVEVSVAGQRIESDLYELRFSVRDTGIGIPPDKLGRLFQSFSQVDASTTRRFGGTGLGLAISKRLCGLMGGRIWVESEAGKGSTFSFTILAAAAQGQAPASQIDLPNMLGKRLLIVDDNATNRRVLTAQAESWKMVARAAACGSEALEWIRAGEPFDAAILDMAMPEMDGLTLAGEIRKHRAATQLPLVMLTSLGRPRSLDAGEERLFAAYLTKPVKPSLLYDVLISVFAGAPGQPSRHAVTQTPIDTGLGERHRLRILLAEDNAVNQKVASRMLARMGYRADIAANGLEVLEALERQEYDVILMDVQMPEMDGMEATRQVRLRWPERSELRIVAMTAHALQGDRERCLAAGMDDYVSKPIQIHELARALLKVEAGPEPAQGTVETSDASEQPAIDRAALAELQQMVGGDDPAALAELIDLFVEDAPNLLASIGEAAAGGDAEALRIAAHTLKSSSLAMGAARMSALCRELEHWEHDRAADGIGEKVGALQAEYERVTAALAGARKRLAPE